MALRDAMAIRPSSSPTPYSSPLPEASSSPHQHRAAPPRTNSNHYMNMMHIHGQGGGNGNAANGNTLVSITGSNRHNTPHGAMFGSSAAAAPRPSNLRPLPQAVRPTGLLNMMIQGHSAGEGRTMVPTEPRVPQERKVKESLDTGVNKEAAAQRDTVKLRKLEQEIEKLKELLKKRTAERDKATGRVDELEKQLAQANKKHSELEINSQATILEKSQLIINLQLSLKQMEDKLAKQSADFEKSKSKEGKAGEELEGLRGALAQERSQRAESESVLKKEIAELQKKIDESNASKRSSSTDFQSQIDKLTIELANKSREASEWEREANKFKKELKGQEASFSEWKARIEAINDYILKICQPQFSVVKDESLAPVAPTGDPSTSGQEGYVLVPLPLMLQGYGLLPQELKKRIASDYEANKKDFASALPRRASRP